MSRQQENTTKVVFAEQLAKAMRERDLCQDDIAHALNLTQAAVSKWTKGTVPNGTQLLRLAEFFGVTMEWLLTGHGSTEVQQMDSTRSPPATDWRARALAAERQLAEIKALLGKTGSK